MPTPRSRPERRRDTEHRLTHDIDVWVASASPEGAPYLVPCRCPSTGTAKALLVVTATEARPAGTWPPPEPFGWGWATRDVSMIEGEVEVLEIDALPPQRGDRFVAHTGSDPRALATPYRWFGISRRRSRLRALDCRGPEILHPSQLEPIARLSGG